MTPSAQIPLQYATIPATILVEECNQKPAECHPQMSASAIPPHFSQKRYRRS